MKIQQLKVNVVLPVSVDGPKLPYPIRATLLGESSPSALKIYRQWYNAPDSDLSQWLNNSFEQSSKKLPAKGGVYFQFGKKDEGDGAENDAVYVGQTNDFCRRFADHNRQETGLCSWYMAICFAMDNADEGFRLAIERKLCDSIKHGLCTTKKATKTINADCSRNFQRQLEAIVAMTTALGHRDIFVDELNEKEDMTSGEKPLATTQLFVCTNKDNSYCAKGYETKDGNFVVLAGSRISTGIAEMFKPVSYWNKRIELDNSDIVKDRILTENCEFRCSSEAAAVVRGCSSNGYEVWKTENGGMSFGEYVKAKGRHSEV